MGAETFYVTRTGKTAREAFDAAVKDAQYEHGHGGYTGTIAEKDSFVLIPVPPGIDARTFLTIIRNGRDGEDTSTLAPAIQAAATKAIEQTDDKWGPAGCIEVEPGTFTFFGWASS